MAEGSKLLEEAKSSSKEDLNDDLIAKILLEAEKNRLNGKYREAQTQYLTLLGLCPEHKEAELGLAEIYLAFGHYEEAQWLFNKYPADLRAQAGVEVVRYATQLGGEPASPKAEYKGTGAHHTDVFKRFAEYAFQKQEFKAANLLYKAAVRSHPRIPTLHFGLANSYIKLDEYHLAQHHYGVVSNSSLSQQSEFLQAWGASSLQLGEYEKAAICFQTLRERDQNNITWLVHYAYALEAMGRPESSALYLNATKLALKDSSQALQLSFALYKNKKYPQALQCLKCWVTDTTDDQSKVIILQAYILLAQNEKQQLQGILRIVDEHKPSLDVEIIRVLALPQEADLKPLLAMLQNFPRRIDARLALAEAMLARGDKSAASEQLEAVLKHYPHNQRALIIKEDLLSKAESISEVVSAYVYYKNLAKTKEVPAGVQDKLDQLYIRLEGFSGSNISNEATKLYVSQKKYAEAAELYQIVVNKKPQSHIAHDNLGNVLCELGQYQAAAAHYTKARELSQDPQYDIHHGMALSAVGEHKEAIAVLKSAHEKQPQEFQPLIYLGNEFYALGEHKQALTFYQRAEKVEPGGAVSLTSQARALVKLTHYEQALLLIEDVLEQGVQIPGAVAVYQQICEELGEHTVIVFKMERVRRREKPIRSIDFSQYPLNDKNFRNLVRHIANHPTLETLKLSRMNQNDNCLEALVNVIIDNNHQLSQLAFGDIPINPGNGVFQKRLSALLFRNKLLRQATISTDDLRAIDLDKNILRPLDLQKILARHVNIPTIDFSNKQLAVLNSNPPWIMQRESWGDKEHSAVTHLNLSDNRLGDLGVKQLRQWLFEDGDGYLCFPNLNRLDLRNNNILFLGFTYFFNENFFEKEGYELQQIDFSDNAIDTEGTQADKETLLEIAEKIQDLNRLRKAAGKAPLNVNLSGNGLNATYLEPMSQTEGAFGSMKDRINKGDSKQEIKASATTTHAELTVPDDHSCLFWSVALGVLIPVLNDETAYREAFNQLFVTQGDVQDVNLFDIYSAGLRRRIQDFVATNNTRIIERQSDDDPFYRLINHYFRQKVASYIAANPQVYTDAMLERTNEAYVTALRSSNFWGGQIEIHAIFRLLDENYQLEVAGAAGSNFPAAGKPIINLVFTNAKKDLSGPQNHYNVRMLLPTPVAVQIKDSKSDNPLKSSQNQVVSSLVEDQASIGVNCAGGKVAKEGTVPLTPSGTFFEKSKYLPSSLAREQCYVIKKPDDKKESKSLPSWSAGLWAAPIIATKSRIPPYTLTISQHSWVVYLAANKTEKLGSEHAMLYLEGLNDYGQRFIHRCHITTDGEQGGLARVSYEALSLFDMQNAEKTKLFESQNISSGVGRLLQSRLKNSHNSLIPYSIVPFGPRKNCLQWCIEQLDAENIPVSPVMRKESRPSKAVKSAQAANVKK